MTDIEQNIDTKIIEKYGDDLLNNINDSEKNIYRNFLKFAILRYDLFENKIKINNFLRKLRKLKNNDKELHNKKQIFELIDTYLGVSEVEKKQNGEVFTPFTLIEEMLDTLPKDVWSNPNLKWLDPANGIGNFPAVILSRLMFGLKDVIKNGKERYKHIMENMIYTCDISNKNTWLYVNIFDPDNELKLNFYQGSFLEEDFDTHMKNVWEIDKFDIVVGNPPYNANQKSKGKRGGGDTLWDKFTIKLLNIILKENGYLVFVHPTLWRKPQSKRSSTRVVNNLMMNKQIHYLEMHNSNDGMKTFNAGTRYDFYCLENCEIYKKTKINDENRKNILLDLKKYDFIPNKNIDFFDTLLPKFEEKCDIIFNRTNYGTDKKWISNKKDENFKYTLIHSTPKSGTRYMYSSRNDKGHFDISKVIFGDSGIYDVIIDMKGEFGMTQHSMAIKVTSIEEAKKIKNVLLSTKFKNFLESVMWSNFQIDWRLFTFLKKDFWKEFMKNNEKTIK